MALSFRYIALLLLSVVISPSLGHAATVGNVIHLDGSATLTRGGVTQPLRNQQKVEAKDKISAHANSNVVLWFNDKSQLTIGSGSTIAINHFVYDSANEHAAIQVSKGFFRFVSGELTKKKRPITIKTPVSTIGIRGTDLFGEVKDNGTTLVGLVECCVDIENDGGYVALEQARTFSKIIDRDTPPSEPVECNIGWIEKSVNALGINKEALGYDD